MRTRTLLAAAALLAAALIRADDASALAATKYKHVVKVSDAKASQHPPGPFPTSVPSGTLPPPVLDATFDPAQWDEISVAGDGKLLAYASSVSEQGLPGQTKRIVVQTVGATSESVTVSGSACDEPSIQFDEFGWRCAFRAKSGSGSTIQLHDFRRAGATPTEATNAITGATAAREPALAARSRVRDVGSGIKIHEADARVAFVSTGNLVGDSNPNQLDQLFLWQEQDKRILQLTKNTMAGTNVVNRPTISKSGDVVFFESTADLDPTAVDPLDSSRVGNPSGARQIFRWRRVDGNDQSKGVAQITFVPAGKCFSPRTDLAGRFVLFASSGDPFAGSNADGNFEIFSWNGALTQLTQSSVGHNVFPRPTSRPDLFAFYSSCPPPADGGTLPVAQFGTSGAEEISPKPFVYRRGNVDFVHGLDNAENVHRLSGTTDSGGARTTQQKIPVFSGPPAPGTSIADVFFAENQLPRPPKKTSKADEDAQIFAFILRASR